MRRVLNWALQFRVLILFVSALIIFMGVTRLGDSRIDVLPEFAPPYVEIQTEALGLSAREVEDLVTLNLEELLERNALVALNSLQVSSRALVSHSSFRARHRHNEGAASGAGAAHVRLCASQCVETTDHAQSALGHKPSR